MTQGIQSYILKLHACEPKLKDTLEYAVQNRVENGSPCIQIAQPNCNLHVMGRLGKSQLLSVFFFSLKVGDKNYSILSKLFIVIIRILLYIRILTNYKIYQRKGHFKHLLYIGPFQSIHTQDYFEEILKQGICYQYEQSGWDLHLLSLLNAGV